MIITVTFKLFIVAIYVIKSVDKTKHRSFFKNIPPLFNRSDEGLTLKTSASKLFMVTKFTLSAQLILLNYLIVIIVSKTHPLRGFVVCRSIWKAKFLFAFDGTEASPNIFIKRGLRREPQPPLTT